MARVKFVCSGCHVKEPLGKKNFRVSNWCKRCNSWKPKTQNMCECCKNFLRTAPRNPVKPIPYVRI